MKYSEIVAISSRFSALVLPFTPTSSLLRAYRMNERLLRKEAQSPRSYYFAARTWQLPPQG